MDDDNQAGPSKPKKKRQYRNELAKEEKEKTKKQKFRDEWLQVRISISSVIGWHGSLGYIH